MDLPVRPGLRSGAAHIHQEGSRFGTTQVTGGSVFQGNFSGVTINSTARPDFAGQFSHSSLEPVKAYVPRAFLRDEIKTQLCDDAADTNTKTLVVWGLGGAGKTQLVLDYVRQYRTDYKATFWIEAGRKESLERDFVNLYQTLFGVQMVAGQETVSVDSAVIGVKSWFSSQRGPWLIVFDGADIIENEEVTEYIDIKRFIPDVASLHIIVTSRSSTAKDMTRLEGVQVGDMEEAQAAELFYKYSRLRRDNQDIEHEVRAIVKELGYLALAVTLASTYVGRTPRLQSDVKAYLPEYRQRRRELLKRKPESLIHQYSESVLTTWETSYHAIHEQSSEASTLMTMLSFFSFDDIFLQLFGTSRQLESTRSTGSAIEVSSTPTEDIYKLEGCFEMLQRYSFVQWKEDQQSYAMHKLVHAWGYDRLTEDEQHRFSVTTFKLVVKAINGCGNTPEEKLRLVPHVMANFAMLGGTGRAWDQAADGTLNELVLAGVFIANIGRLPEGRVIQEFIWNEKRRLLGEEHPDTISAMYNLAVTLGYQGQLDEAAKMKKEVLEKRRRILGEEHPDTILVMSNLAQTLGDQGQVDEAAKIKKEVLEKRMRILGEEHLDTISAIGNLAVTLGDQGQLDEAAKMKKEVFEKMRRILGEEHSYTMSAMSNLASTLEDQGQRVEAAKMQKEVLEKMRRILGEEHPSTISAMNNLAVTLGDQGQLDEAAKMKKEVLENRRRILGEEHLDTILAMSNLAKTLGDQGQLDEAAKIKKEVFEKRRRILGEEHPSTMSAMSNLASTLEDQGQLVEAAKMFKEVFEKMRRILGEEHPHTILVMSNLAQTLGDQGQLDEAAKNIQTQS
ncbi:TPR-like protein [Mytilinidion resinicola]|uniref:TPR-like protein n=1 Tax=Mytilinidion resinicola TaxID=574789 RepID=A0A6A6Y7V1_9PEZI|nr:TPR-like protein [Mytilinidion resinicola]KAF2804628.1 TPR-like protein [Mytilinidion resinicola]